MLRLNNPFIKGFSTGLVLQIAIGPVFIFTVNTALQQGLLCGLSAVTAVTIADYLFIVLALAGAGELLKAERIQRPLSVLSAIILVVFGLVIMKNGIDFNPARDVAAVVHATVTECFISAFLLTVSNPLSILFWTGMFTSRAMECSFEKKGLLAFGLSAGLATFVFLGICVIVFSLVKTMLPLQVFRFLNMIAGAMIAGYGMVRMVSAVRGIR